MTSPIRCVLFDLDGVLVDATEWHYEALNRQGQRRTIAHAFRENPLRFVVYLALVAAVLYFSLKPFFALGQ